MRGTGAGTTIRAMTEADRTNSWLPGAAGSGKHHDRHIWIWVAGLIVVVAAYAWAVDFVTFEGQRTVYTANCDGGVWAGKRCTGRLTAGDRIRYLALPPHGEVVFWTAGASEPAGKLTGCTVKSGRSWTCPPGSEAKRSVTLKMELGEPQVDPGGRTRSLHAISKLRWYLLSLGLPTGATANT